MVDLWPEWSICLAVLGTLWGIMSGLPTTEIGIVALTFFSNQVGYNILDLGGGFVNILLPIELVLYLSVLPSTRL